MRASYSLIVKTTRKRFAAHHVIICLGDLIERIDLVHGPDAGTRAEGERILRVDRCTGIPPFDRTAPHEQRQRRNLHRLGRADDQERAINGQAPLNGGHGIAAGRRRQDNPGAAQFHELGRGVLCLAVDVDRGAELAGERLLVFATSDSDRVKAHLGGVLNAEVAEAAEPEDGDDVACPRATVAQSVEGGEAGAHRVGRRR